MARESKTPERKVEKHSLTAALLRYAGLTASDIPLSPGGGLEVTLDEAWAEVARRGITVNMPEPLAPPNPKAARKYVRKLMGWGAHLIRLREGTKNPVEFGWQHSEPLTEDEAVEWLASGGNLGILCSASGENGLLVLDAENAASTELVTAAGMTPTVVTAAAQDPTTVKSGGCHVLIPLRKGVDVSRLEAKLGVRSGEALFDIMVGPRFLVAPGSRLHDIPGFRYEFAGDGPAFRPELWGSYDPAWLLDPAAPAPQVPGIEPLQGIARKRERVRRAPSPDGDRLTAEVDSRPWSEWIDGDPRVMVIAVDYRCGCDVFHWAGASEPRSGIFHDGCQYGYAVHVFSGTLIEKMGGATHMSRLHFAAFLRGVDTREGLIDLAQEHGIRMGRRLRGITLDDIAASAPGEAVLQVLAGGGQPPTDPTTRRLSSVPNIGSVHPSGDTAADQAGGAEPDAESEPEPEPAAQESAPAGSVNLDLFPSAQSGESGEDSGLAMFRRLNEIGNDEFWNSLPILRSINRSAAAGGVYNWGLLGAVLPRICCTIPPHIRLVGGSGKPGGVESGGSLNLNTVLLGAPEAGKSETIKISADLVSLPPHASEVPAGTGEGLIKSFGYYKKKSGKDAAGDPANGETTDPVSSEGYEYVHLTDTVLLVAGEIADLTAEMVRRGTKMTSVLRSMWVGEQTGTTTGEVERRTKLKPHSYRFGALLGGQVELDTIDQLFGEGRFGTIQRFLFFPVTTVPASGDPVVPIILPIIDWSDGSPAAESIGALVVGRRPVWITRPATAHEEMEAYKAAKQARAHLAFSVTEARRRGDDDEALESLIGHELFHQFKIAGVLAVGDGLRQPTDLHWWAAGRIMAARAVVVGTVAQVLAVLRESADRRVGRSRGRSQAEAKRAEQEAEDGYRADIALRALKAIAEKGEPASEADIAKTLGKAQGRVLTEVLQSMVEGGSLFRVGVNRRSNPLFWTSPPKVNAAGA